MPDHGSVLLGLRLIREVGDKGAQLIVDERERHGLYAGAGDLVRRTGLKAQAVLSLVQAGAFDGLTPQPQGCPVGRRSLHPALQERATNLLGPHWEPGAGACRLYGVPEDGGGVPGHGHATPGGM